MRYTLFSIMILSLLLTRTAPSVAQDLTSITSERFSYSFMTFEWVASDEGDSGIDLGLSYPISDLVHATFGGSNRDSAWSVGLGFNWSPTENIDLLVGAVFEDSEGLGLGGDSVATVRGSFRYTARIQLGSSLEVAPFWDVEPGDEPAYVDTWGIDTYYTLSSGYELIIGTEEFDEFSFGLRLGF